MTTDWRAAYQKLVAGTVDVRLNDDDSLDEIVGYGGFHLEQMDDDVWFLSVGDCRMNVLLDAGHLLIKPIESETWKEERERVAKAKFGIF